MPELFTILIKVNIALVLFCLGYYMVLRKLTFYTLNRVYLVTAIIVSSAYPFIDLSLVAQRHQEIIAPVQNVVLVWKAPAEDFLKQTTYWTWLEILFWAGATVFALRLLFQLISLYKIYSRSTGREINGQMVRVVSGDISPFSFWRSIYINPEKLSDTDLHNILEHEQIHVSEWHTLDVLLTEISVIFYWFNPGIWMMKKAVRENIEFITDRKILRKGLDSKAYQYSLLNITFNNPAPAITSNFNFSTLKKRIKMMNAKRSSNLNLTRYAFLVPIVAICLFIFSLSKAESVQASPAFKAVAAAVEDFKSVTFNADTTPVKKKATKTPATKKASATGATTGVTYNNVNKEPSIRLRNLGSGESIVFIIDGEMASAEAFNNLNFNQVKSINVIKDNATAFLSRIPGAPVAADKSLGVIVVSTTKGLTTTTAGAGIKNVDVVGYGVTFRDTRQADTTGSFSSRIGRRVMGVAGPNDPLILVDGKERSSIKSIDPNDIETVSVLKDASAINTYGERAQNGVIVVTTKDGKYNNHNFDERLIVVDGKIETERSLKQINADEIESFTVLKGASATSLYGEKAKNGAIIITTKEK